MILKDLLTEGEAIYCITRCACQPIYIIGPKVEDTYRELDMGGCIEDTLHRLIDNGADDTEIFSILSAAQPDPEEKTKAPSQDDDMNMNNLNDDYDVDLGYVIYDFYPTGIEHTGVEYEEPYSTYMVVLYTDSNKILDTRFQMEDELSDDDILDCLDAAGYLEKTGHEQDEIIVMENKDGSGFKIVYALDFEPLMELTKTSDFQSTLAAA